ncbi:hypothetical protein FA10DRAFT_266841 [Acaromyces ingoldii]|uniref:Uncharacterized protein n=1 Tax=Acaromyces ingoldii TaxID=215250 RepID=A0A316YMC5_9BASI|nr:hypothetical protein FA10DRAFT_266841 [Acaromyces ingoldii]PWN90351.1 hypothetical protein FA10DRAFT_266841 [Acaromyces ingoldii]
MPAISRRDTGERSLSGGAIAGIIVAIVVVFLLLAGLLVWKLLQYRKERRDPNSTTNMEKRARQRAIALARAEKHLATSRTTGNYGPGTVVPASVSGDHTAVDTPTDEPRNSLGLANASSTGQPEMTSAEEPVTAEVMHNPEGAVEARAIENHHMAQPSDFNEQDGEPWKGKRNWRSFMGRGKTQHTGQPLIEKDGDAPAPGGPEDDQPEPAPGQGRCAHM